MVCSSYGSLPWLLKILVETCILEHLLLGLKQLKKVSLMLKLKSISSSLLSSSSKSMKLNPKLVGAAWAEKIKIEMEMEKRGELVKSDFDADWLPNFGRVWQSGTQNDSRKEFELEKQKLPKDEGQSGMPIKIQPYDSKRMV